MNLIKILTAESQVNVKIYDLIENLYTIISNEKWLKKYIFWELELLKTLGYDLELDSLVNKKIINNEIVYVAESSSEKKIVPNFLIDKNDNNSNLENLLKGLKLVGDYMDKTILKPNNLNYPISRNQFVSSLK
jgi:DNA repair protein RecO (recombination protein O)